MSKKKKKTILNVIGSRRIMADLKVLIKREKHKAEICYRIRDKKTDDFEKMYWEAKGDAILDLVDKLLIFSDKYRIL